MKALTSTVKGLKVIVLAAALAVAAGSFGMASGASADGGNSITFGTPAAVSTSHQISFTAQTAPSAGGTMTLQAPAAAGTLTLTAPVSISATTADTGSSQSALSAGN